MRKNVTSPLVRRFLDRAGVNYDVPRQAISQLVDTACRGLSSRGPSINLDSLLTSRNISAFEMHHDLTFDGRIEPKGSTFADGFRIILKHCMPQARTRFTLAHEICHTFFYELVPELKFAPHQVDDEEEWLCNAGAAEILMPAKAVRVSSSGLPESIETLDFLRKKYTVSPQAMVLRLNELRVWNSQLSFWYRMTNGQIGVNRIYGGLKVPWRWMEEQVIEQAFFSGNNQKLTGRTFVGYTDSSGHTRVKPTYYELRKLRDSVMALWCRTPKIAEAWNLTSGGKSLGFVASRKAASV